ncbi:MAG: competence/damage-inducible protein A [Clostridia bacterium]|nr:competence/damage-inducible protein A [Clostridia bacterium]
MNKEFIKSAEILCVGTELLLGEVVNTNAAYIAARLAELGVSVYHQSVVGDNPERLRRELSSALARCDLVIMTGGLGPTYDDLTKETAAELFGKRLVMDERALSEIKDYFARTGRKMAESNVKQALVPEGAAVLYNQWGTAPGMIIEGDEKSDLSYKRAILLPGPPREMRNMFDFYVTEYLAERTASRIVSRNIHLIGIGESSAEELLRPLIDESINPSLAPYAKDGELRFRVTASADSVEKAEQMCDSLVARVLDSEVGKFVYGIDVGSVEGAVVKSLLDGGETLSTVESCTGGLIAKRLTDIAGVSQVYLGGAVTYANEAKEKLVGVRHETLLAHGAVSEETAREMAEGIRLALGADYGISTTGIAGPGGGTPDKPVGTVYIAVASKEKTLVKRLQLPPMRDREYIRTASATNALALVLEVKGLIGKK